MSQTREGNYSINVYDYHPRPDYYNNKGNEDNNYSYKTKNNNNNNDAIHGQINKMMNSKEALWKADWYSRRNYEDTHHYYSDGNDDDNLYLDLKTGEFGQSILGNYDDNVQSEVIIETDLINRINNINQINEINHSNLIIQPRLVKEDQIKQNRAANHRTTNTTQSVKPQSTHTTSAGSHAIKLNVNYINHKLVANHSSSTTKLATSHASSTTKLATNPSSTTTKLVAHPVPTTKASPNHASTTIKLVSDHDSELIFNTNGGVINKKKDQEPTSPEVTCLGRVRIKKRINKHKKPSNTSVNDAISNGSNTTHTSSSDQMDEKIQISQTNLRLRRRIRKRVSKEADDQLSTKMDLCMIKGGLIKEIGSNQISTNEANKAKLRNSANKTDSSSETKSKVGIFSQLYKDRGPGIKDQDHNHINNTKIKAVADQDENIASSMTKKLGKNRHNSDHSNVRITDQSDADVIIDLSRFGSSRDQIWAESLTNCLINETNLISNKSQMIHGGDIVDSESFFVPPPQNSLQLMRNSRNKSSDYYHSFITTSTTSVDPSKSKHLQNSIPQSDIMHHNHIAHHSTLAEFQPKIGKSNTTPPRSMKISSHEHNMKHQAINNTAHGDHTMISLWQRRRIPQPSAIDLNSK